MQSQVLVKGLLGHFHLPAHIPLWRFVQVERRHNQTAPGIAGRSRSPPRAAIQASWCHRSTPGPLWRVRSWSCPVNCFPESSHRHQRGSYWTSSQRYFRVWNEWKEDQSCQYLETSPLRFIGQHQFQFWYHLFWHFQCLPRDSPLPRGCQLNHPCPSSCSSCSSFASSFWHPASIQGHESFWYPINQPHHASLHQQHSQGYARLSDKLGLGLSLARNCLRRALGGLSLRQKWSGRGSSRRHTCPYDTDQSRGRSSPLCAVSNS